MYIDGGQFSFLNNGTPNCWYSNTILSIDLSQNWTNSTVMIQSTVKPVGAPNLKWPSMWYDESRELLYSGFTGISPLFEIDSDPAPPDLSLWTFKPDNTGAGTWNELFNPTATVWGNINRIYTPEMAWDKSTVHMLGGFPIIDNEPWEYNGGNVTLTGEVRFNMLDQTFSNYTTENGLNSTKGRAQGAMEFIPAFGPEGIFVTMGGYDSNTCVDFDSVLVFDPSTQMWYNQTTTGSSPSPRVAFCTAAISSTSNTYEMSESQSTKSLTIVPTLLLDSFTAEVRNASGRRLSPSTPSTS